jgi:hypothetical protein
VQVKYAIVELLLPLIVLAVAVAIWLWRKRRAQTERCGAETMVTLANAEDSHGFYVGMKTDIGGKLGTVCWVNHRTGMIGIVYK